MKPHLWVMLLNSLSKGEGESSGSGGSGSRSQKLGGLSLQRLCHSRSQPVVRRL